MKIIVTALTGISIAMPIPVGDGTYVRHAGFCSRKVSTTPINAPAASEVVIQDRRAAASGFATAGPVSSCVTSFANPTHRCDVGLSNCAFSPITP